MKAKLKTILKTILFFVPFIIGTVGFSLALHDGILNAMYRAMRLYVTELDCEYADVTPLIEIARWTSPMMSAAAILTVLSRFFESLRVFRSVRKGNAVALHGEGDHLASLTEQLGSRAVSGKSALAKRADKQVLLFEDDGKMLSYLGANREELLRDGHTVYLCTDRLMRDDYSNASILVSNRAEICARKYWREHPVPTAAGRQNIAIIGFDNTGCQILSYALLTNVLGKETKILYHIFGDSAEYRALHPQLGEIAAIGEEVPDKDSIFFYDGPWYEEAETLRRADRIILASEDDEENLITLNRLSQLGVSGPVHIALRSGEALSDLWGDAEAFGSDESIFTEENIFDEATFADAKRIHSVYFRQYGLPKDAGTLTEKQIEALSGEDWRKQSAFTIYSNVAQADHIPVKIRILLGDGGANEPDAGKKAAAVYNAMTYEEKMDLARIEHTRWARYHYLNNWVYDPVRNNAERKHPMLVPFEALSEENKRKDCDAWENAFRLFRSAGGNA